MNPQAELIAAECQTSLTVLGELVMGAEVASRDAMGELSLALPNSNAESFKKQEELSELVLAAEAKNLGVIDAYSRLEDAFNRLLLQLRHPCPSAH